ncbi:MAG TPA: PHB depolymerase family esterase [Acidobacteriaceae bacterium]|nr:PHB depolymerase family esterase [Acidobacteriaceae bacterium]
MNLRHELRRQPWQKFRRTLRSPLGGIHERGGRLREISDFGSNPGHLRMFGYRPAILAENPALVVALHGCTQTAGSYDLGSGWSTLAERHGFVLVFPEQQRSNNPNGCFNWFDPRHTQRDHGEPLSIRQMIEKSVADNGIDRRRIFVTGLSAGGAMTSILLACYPDVFSGGAIIAGLPYGAATNVQQAFESMRQSPARAASEWGDLIRNASPHRGPWPRVSVWHGDADTTVIPRNALEILKQWTDVHGLPLSPSMKTRVDGFPREVWMNQAGEELIEAYTIPNMAHGTPVAISGSGEACGAPEPFFLPVGISSSYQIAKFFGLTVALARETTITSLPEDLGTDDSVLEGEVLGRESEPQGRTSKPPLAAGIEAVINKALRAAGLIQG